MRLHPSNFLVIARFWPPTKNWKSVLLSLFSFNKYPSDEQVVAFFVDAVGRGVADSEERIDKKKTQLWVNHHLRRLQRYCCWNLSLRHVLLQFI